MKGRKTEIEMIGILPWMKYIYKGHILNWFWKDRLSRRITRNLAFGDFKMTYLKKFADYAANIKMPAEFKPHPENSNDKIFTLWFQGLDNAPDIVKKCLNSIRKVYGERLVVLTDENLYNYIELPEFIKRKRMEKKIGAANFSDLVRIELLYKIGGYWFDATDLLTGPIPEVITESSFFMFVTSKVFFPHMFVQTCFMRGMAGDPLMGMWRDLVHEYWKREDQAVDYFLVHMLLKLLIKENAEAAALFEKMPKMIMDPTHLLWYKYGNQPYDDVLFEEICKSAFFQKCSYRPQRNGIKEIIPGSMVDVVINEKFSF